MKKKGFLRNIKYQYLQKIPFIFIKACSLLLQFFSIRIIIKKYINVSNQMTHLIQNKKSCFVKGGVSWTKRLL